MKEDYLLGLFLLFRFKLLSFFWGGINTLNLFTHCVCVSHLNRTRFTLLYMS